MIWFNFFLPTRSHVVGKIGPVHLQFIFTQNLLDCRGFFRIFHPLQMNEQMYFFTCRIWFRWFDWWNNQSKQQRSLNWQKWICCGFLEFWSILFLLKVIFNIPHLKQPWSLETNTSKYINLAVFKRYILAHFFCWWLEILTGIPNLIWNFWFDFFPLTVDFMSNIEIKI